MEESILMRLIIKPLRYCLIAIVLIGVGYGLVSGDMKRGMELYMGIYQNTAGKVITWYMESRVERIQNRMETRLETLQENQNQLSEPKE